MKEVLEVQQFFAKLSDIRRKPTFGSLSEIEDMIEKASHMFALCTDIHNYLRELEEQRDAEYPDQQRIMVDELHAALEVSA
jgi:hypothetical protein